MILRKKRVTNAQSYFLPSIICTDKITAAVFFQSAVSYTHLFGFNIWSGFELFGQNVLGMEDFLVSNIL